MKRLNRSAICGFFTVICTAFIAIFSSLSCPAGDAKNSSHRPTNSVPTTTSSSSVIRLDKLEAGPIPLVAVTLKPTADDKVAHPENKDSQETKSGKAKAASVQLDKQQAKKDEQLSLDRWADAIKMGLSLGILTAMAMYASNLIQQRPRAEMAGVRTIAVAAGVVGVIATIVAYLIATYWHGGAMGRTAPGPRQWVVLQSDAYHFDVSMPQPVKLQREQVHEFWKNTILHDDDDKNCMQVTYEQNEESMKHEGPKTAFDIPKAAFNPRVSATRAAQNWVDLYRAKVTSHKTVEVPGMAVGLDVEGQISEGWSFHVLSYATESGQSYVAVVSGSTPFVNSPDAKRFLSSLHFKQ